jgi:hypothetical protein
MKMQNKLRELAEQQDGILYIEQVESWIEEIVEQLVEQIDNNRGWEDEDYYWGETKGYEHAIEIVKGGVDNAELK